MIKTFLTLTAALLCAQGTIMAQQATPQNGIDNSLKLATTTPLTAGKTTATQSRLVAVTTRSKILGTLTLADSTHCTYNPGHGYDNVLEEWKYTQANSWTWDFNAWVDDNRSTHSFNSKSQITSTFYENNDGTGWQGEEFISYSYDAAGHEIGNLDAYYSGSSWDSTRNTFTLNTSGQVTLQLIENYNPGTMAWENSMRITTTYNASGQVETVTNEDWTGSTWQNSFRTTNTYTAILLTSTLSETWMGSWQNSGKTEYAYNSQAQVIMQENFWWNSGVWAPSRRSTNAYDISGYVTSVTEEMYVPIPGGYENLKRTLTDYNSYHWETKKTEESWNSGANQFEMQNGDNETRYYYEDYTTGIKEDNTNPALLQVYPTPAKGNLNLRIAFGEATAPVVILLDMSGRMVKQLQLPGAKNHSTTIDVSSLAPGNYILNMNTNGKMTTQKVVVE